MAVAAKPALQGSLNDVAPLDLARETAAIALIDPHAGEILAASPTGRDALGLFPYAAFPIALDPAMPAIARLRQIAGGEASTKGDAETLLFWNSGRLKRVRCRIARWAAGSNALLLHIEVPETIEERQPPPAREAPQSAPATPPAAKPTAAFDADTIAKLAHELKTPLTAIAAAAEIMRDERLGEMKNARYLGYAADIHDSATHALDVISSLLSDRAKPAVPVSRLIAIDLNAIVSRTVSSVKALAESCGLNLTLETQGTKPHVVANPTALRQILLNLLTNAIKFTPRGGDVQVATGHIPDGRVFLAVRDTGWGMTSNAAAQSISGGEVQPEWARGSGIGLPLVETLASEMGAEIKIDSEPGSGTLVTLLFGDFTRRFK
jgi:two-component system cell cycle sensor histidine kinase PleC